MQKMKIVIIITSLAEELIAKNERSQPSVVTFRSNYTSKMATMASDWLRHVDLLWNE